MTWLGGGSRSCSAWQVSGDDRWTYWLRLTKFTEQRDYQRDSHQGRMVILTGDGTVDCADVAREARRHSADGSHVKPPRWRVNNALNQFCED